MSFMALFRFPNLSLRYEGNGRIEDVHLFMSCVYNFWLHRGFWGVCFASCIDFLNAVVLWFTIFFLTLMVDWDMVFCNGSPTCATLGLAHAPSMKHLSGAGACVALILLVAAGAACLYELFHFIEVTCLQREMHQMLRPVVDVGFLTPAHRMVYIWQRHRAHASGHEELRMRGELPYIADLNWGDFVERLCSHIQMDKSFGMASHREFDALRAIQALMVYDNYIIALHENRILDEGALQYADDRLLKVLIGSMFDSFNTFDPNRDKLFAARTALFQHLLMHLFLYPFALAFFLVKLAVKNVAQVRFDVSDYFASDWSNQARWTFRLYNEVPHIHSARLGTGRRIAIQMKANLVQESQLARLATRITSSIVVVVIFLSFFNTSLLLDAQLLSHSLVWWLSVALMIYSLMKSVRVPLREYVYEDDLQNLIGSIHYSQREWYYSANLFINTITWDFLYTRFYLLLSSTIQVICMPLILVLVSMDQSLPRLVEFITASSVRIDSFGCIAVGSDFDSEQNWKQRSDAERDAGMKNSSAVRQDLSTDKMSWGSKARMNGSGIGGNTTTATTNTTTTTSNGNTTGPQKHEYEFKLAESLGFTVCGSNAKGERSVASFAAVYREWAKRVAASAEPKQKNDAAALREQYMRDLESTDAEALVPVDSSASDVDLQPSESAEGNIFDTAAAKKSNTAMDKSASSFKGYFAPTKMQVSREEEEEEGTPRQPHSMANFISTLQLRADMKQETLYTGDTPRTAYDRQKLFVSVLDGNDDERVLIDGSSNRRFQSESTLHSSSVTFPHRHRSDMMMRQSSMAPFTSRVAARYGTGDEGEPSRRDGEGEEDVEMTRRV